jgi:molecular chaperone GrpE
MTEPKGPKVSLPDELMAELDEKKSEIEAPEPTPPAAPPPPGAAPPAANEAAELKDRYLRLAADFDNFRRRTLKERQDLLLYGGENLIKELLPIVDNLERAVEHGRKEEQRGDSDNLLQGIELTYRSVMQLLTRQGVTEIQALGQPFDPQIHEAVRRVARSDKPAGTVVEVYQKGYLLKDRMLRPAMVAVAEES